MQFSPPPSDNLDLVAQRLTHQAKTAGSSDNITIVVVFLKPVEELVRLADNEYAEAPEPAREELYAGVTSTCKYVSATATGEEVVAVTAAGTAMNGNENPFASPLITAEANNGGAFESSAGGASFINESSPDPFASASEDGGTSAAQPISGPDQFKQASPSMFEESVASPAATEDRSRGADFGEDGGVNAAAGNPHLDGLKGDSGFISPAMMANRGGDSGGGSSEGSGADVAGECTAHERGKKRSNQSEVMRAIQLSLLRSSFAGDNEDDEEEAESREVMSLLASAQGKGVVDEALKVAAAAESDEDDEEAGGWRRRGNENRNKLFSNEPYLHT